MLREYALDPNLLTNWRDFRYFFEKFGVSNGRLISRFPRNWKGMVKEAIKNCNDIEYLKIISCLEEINDKLCRRNHEWNEAMAWLSNAELEHALRPFYAILAAENPHNHSFVLIGDDVDERNELWKPTTELPVPRNADKMADAVSLLLQQSRTIAFIDPHFSPQAGRFRRPLKSFLKVAIMNRTQVIDSVSYYLEAKSPQEYFEEQCHKYLSAVIPETLTVNFIRLDNKPGSEKLHDRFVITERGGFGFTGGLDDGYIGQHTTIKILSDDVYIKTWSDYVSVSPAFNVVDETLVAGSAKCA